MIKSMTGFASVTREDDRSTIAVTIRALNHRYLDLQLRIPQALAALESDVRALVGKYVARGRVEMNLSLQLRQPPGIEVEFNEDFGRALEEALDRARTRGLVSGTLTPGDLLRLPQALTIRERTVDADGTLMPEVAAQARAAVEAALADLESMRAREGEHLRADVDERRTLVADLVAPDRRGTAYGLYNGAIGVAVFPASLLAGLLWQWLSPAAPFFFGAALACVSSCLLLLIPENRKTIFLNLSLNQWLKLRMRAHRKRQPLGLLPLRRRRAMGPPYPLP